MSRRLQAATNKFKGSPSSVSSKRQAIDDYESRNSTPASSRSGTPVPSVTRRSARMATAGPSSRVSAPKPKSPVKKRGVQYEDDDDVGIEQEMYVTDNESYDEQSEDDNADNNVVESEPSEDEFEPEDSEPEDTPVKKRPARPASPDVSPEEVDESTIPPLTLPASSSDLLVANKLILQLFAVYEVLRRFRSIIGLSPFLVEDFIAALVSDEQNVLVSEVHCSLLRTLLHIEETSGTVFGPHDVKDSINISFYFLDSVSWFELARLYLESEPREDFSAALRALSKAHYGLTTVQERLDILQTLTDLVLSTSTVRDEMSREGNIRYDDHCRACQKLGDLLCCETCPSVYHLDCIVPPLETVPEDEWYCSVCTAHQVKGVTDCVSEAEKSGVLCRQEPLGYDRHRRKYWLLCRRLVVEGEDAVWYYSSKAHLLELLEVLDGERWERGLVRALADMKEELLRHFTITEELYKARQGTKRSLLDVEAGALEKVQQEREERRKREEEERKQREEGDGATEPTSEDVTPAVSESATHHDEAVGSEVNKGGSTGVNGTTQEGEDGEQQQEMAVSLDSLEPSVRDAALQALADQGIDLSKNKVNVISKDGGKTLMLVPVTENEEDEEEKGQEEDGGLAVNAATTLASRVTRSRTGSLTPRAFTDSVSLATNSIRVARREATSLLAAAVAGNAEAGGILTRNKATFQQSSTVPYSAYFRLGQDAVYRQYDNQYTSNPLALNRNQHNEERIKRQFFSHKFSLTATCEFKWIGALYGNYTLLISTLRMTMQQLESTIPAAFLHSRWPQHRLVWQKSVQAASAPEDFVRALAQLEACIKPAVFNSVWNDNLGYVKLSRCTTIDKEEKKRLDRSRQKAEEEEARDKRVTTFARFTLGLKHQVWKMKGEEFRVTGQGGWAWVSIARVSRPVCAYSVGLRAVARQLGDNIQRVNGYGGDSAANDNSEEDSSPFLTITNAMSISPTDFAEMPVGDKINGTTVNGDAADQAMDSSSSSGGLVNGYAERNDEHMDIDVCSTAPGTQQSHSDVIDVSRALEERVLYPSVQKPVSRLDGLLERRLRLEEAEEKHRVAYTRILNNQQKQLQLRITGKFDRVTKKFELSSAAPVAAPPPAATKMPFNIKVEKVEGAASMPVEYKLLMVKSAAKSVPFSPDTCYSPLCRQATAESSNVYPCYSVTCPRRTASAAKQEQTDQVQVENKASVDTDAKHDDSHSVTGDSNSELVPGLTNGPVDSDGPRVMKVESLAGLVPDTPEPVMPPTTAAPVNGVVSEAASEPLYRLVLRGMKDRDINRALIKLQDFSLLSMMEDGKVKLTDEVVRNMALKLCGASSTKYFVALTPSNASRPSVGRPPRAAGKKTASLPPGNQFLAGAAKKRSLLVLERAELGQAARVGGLRAVSGFHYEAKTAGAAWPYPCPRPLFRKMWQYHLQIANNLSAIGLQLHILWVCLSWDDMLARAPLSGTNTVTTDDVITTTEVLKKKSVGPYELRNAYLVRKIIVPLGQQERNKIEDYTPQRLGLRVRKRAESPKVKEPTVTEKWVPEEELALWQIKHFHDKEENEKKAAQRQQLVKDGLIVKTVVTGGSGAASAVKTQSSTMSQQQQVQMQMQIEEQLRLQRQAMQQKRLQEQRMSSPLLAATVLKQGGLLTQPTIKTQGVKSNVQLVTGDGVTASVQGLQPGQQLVQLPDGSLRIIGVPSAQQVTGGQALGRPTLRHALVGTPRTQLLQPRPQSVLLTTAPTASPAAAAGQLVLMGGQLVRLMPAGQQQATVIGTPVSAQPKTVTAVQLPNGQIVLQSAAPPAAANTGGIFYMDNMGRLTAAPPAGVVGGRVTAGKHAQVTKGQLRRQSGDGEYTVTSETLESMVQQALQNTSDPNIQAKLVAMHRQMARDNPQSIAAEALALLSEKTPRGRPPRDKGALNMTSARSYAKQLQAEYKAKLQKQRQLEAAGISRQRQVERSTFQQEQVQASRRVTLLLRHRDSLKKDILKKRALLEKAIQFEVQAEVAVSLKAQKHEEARKRKLEAVATAVAEAAAVEPTLTPVVTPSKRRKQVDAEPVAPSPAPAPAPAVAADTPLYCICRTPYDETKFYIGCDQCSNWLHGECVGITELQASTMPSYTCPDCLKPDKNSADENGSDENLYCVCRTPYNASLFYIGCDQCQDWYHGSCVGISEAEAASIESYVCERCQQQQVESPEKAGGTLNQLVLEDHHYKHLKRLLRDLKKHKMSWPFLEPVDTREVPDYLTVIKQPMDLSTVEKKLTSFTYTRFGDFVHDVMLIFDNCRLYNRNDSIFFKCAEAAEAYFHQLLSIVKDKLN